MNKGEGVFMHKLTGYRVAALLVLSALGLQISRLAHAEGNPGFGLNTSRVVVMAQDSRSGAAVALNNTDRVYLVQSRAYPADGNTGWPLTKAVSPKPAVPFLVTPPLQRVDAHGRLPLRILAMPDNHLPQDRESLFFLSTKAIPAQGEPVAGAPAGASGDKQGGHDAGKTARTGDAPMAPTGPQISLALQQYVKLFYRPKGLSATALFDGAVAPKLNMQRVGGRLQVTNPTPYYITFIVLKVGGKPVDDTAKRALVPPKGQQTYPLPAGVSGGEVEWQIVDEFGLATKAERRNLN